MTKVFILFFKTIYRNWVEGSSVLQNTDHVTDVFVDGSPWDQVSLTTQVWEDINQLAVALFLSEGVDENVVDDVSAVDWQQILKNRIFNKILS